MVNFVAALAFHFCLALPAAFTQPGYPLLADACTLMTFRYTDVPGEVEGSYGYHYDGDKARDGNWDSYGPGFGHGDVVGCGIIDDACFFTKNGEFLGVAFRRVQRDLCPTVRLAPGDIVEGNFGQKLFRYELDWKRVKSLCDNLDK